VVDPPTNAPAFTRLDDRAVGVRLAALDQQLAQLETTSGPIGELALATVSGLAEIYGQALARALDLVDPALLQRMLSDELIGHLLVLHGIHPDRDAAREYDPGPDPGARPDPGPPGLVQIDLARGRGAKSGRDG